MACVALVTLGGIICLPRVAERTRLTAEAWSLRMKIRHAVVEVGLWMNLFPDIYLRSYRVDEDD